MKCIDPAIMTPADRLAEICAMLAAGVQRLRTAGIKAGEGGTNLQVRLAAIGASEAPCGWHVQNPKSRRATT